jgi:hypothetical protein
MRYKIYKNATGGWNLKLTHNHIEVGFFTDKNKYLEKIPRPNKKKFSYEINMSNIKNSAGLNAIYTNITEEILNNLKGKYTKHKELFNDAIKELRKVMEVNENSDSNTNHHRM